MQASSPASSPDLLRDFWVADRRLTTGDTFDIRSIVLAMLDLTTPLEALAFLYKSQTAATYAWLHAIIASHPHLDQSALSLSTLFDDEYLPRKYKSELILQIARCNNNLEDSSVFRKLLRGVPVNIRAKRSALASRNIGARLLVILLCQYTDKYGDVMTFDEILQRYGEIGRMAALRTITETQWVWDDEYRWMLYDVVRCLLRRGDYDPATRFAALDTRCRSSDLIREFVGGSDHATLIEALIQRKDANALACMFAAGKYGVTPRDIYATIDKLSGNMQQFMRGCVMSGVTLYCCSRPRNISKCVTYAQFLAACGLLGKYDVSDAEMREECCGTSLIKFIARRAYPVTPAAYARVMQLSSAVDIREVLAARYAVKYTKDWEKREVLSAEEWEKRKRAAGDLL